MLPCRSVSLRGWARDVRGLMLIEAGRIKGFVVAGMDLTRGEMWVLGNLQCFRHVKKVHVKVCSGITPFHFS